ncbi:23S rRNA (uracil(1939)-C(5))-methyltransferase RlmD [Candidatus Uhrbacteria bacterium]|nr:23S rRNA (uracil(1939)-C(5))-methyltransferase RlmD [Candidatus Uhrbacteria bacterium]
MTLCPKKEICGSCSWSHIPYEKQLKAKLSDVNGSLALKGLDLVCYSLIPSPKTDHYRNRMDFAIDFQGRVGLKEKGKWWKVIDGHACFLSDERIEALFHQVRAWARACGLSFWDRKAHTGMLRYAVIRCTSLGETLVTVVTSAPETPADAETCRTALRLLNETSRPTTLVWAQNSTITDVSYGDNLEVIAGPGVLMEEIGGIHYRISPQAFFQTNSFAAPILQKTVQEFCGDLSEKTLLDLYCGTGFFATALSSSAHRTIGVELSKDAILDARMNAELNGTDIEYHDAKTEDFDWASFGADVVILDPPRSGMHDKALQDLLRIKPPSIVYVSCNPKNFAREMVLLQKTYLVQAMRAIDLFPHTPHVELVTHLVRL